MNLTITGHHLEVTPAIRGYVEDKMDRIARHFDQVIDLSVILAVEKLKHKAEVNLRVRGKDIYVEPSTPSPTSWIARCSSTRKSPPTCTASPAASNGKARKRNKAAVHAYPCRRERADRGSMDRP